MVKRKYEREEEEEGKVVPMRRLHAVIKCMDSQSQSKCSHTTYVASHAAKHNIYEECATHRSFSAKLLHNAK